MDFILTLIPTWLIVVSLSMSIIIVLGADIVKTIPFIGKYGYFVLPIGLMVIMLSVYLLTTNHVNSKWEEKVLLLELKNNELKLKQMDINKEIVVKEIEIPIEKIITRSRIIKEEIPVLIPTEKDCTISTDVVRLYNESIKRIE